MQGVSPPIGHLEFRKGVLHQMYKKSWSKYHQLVLPTVYRAQGLQLLHEEWGHQRIEHTLALVRESFFWNTVCQDVSSWVKLCKRCKKAKALYYDPNVNQGLLTASCPLDLVCLDFTEMDHSKDEKENILIMMDTFSNFPVAVVTCNEQAKMVVKALVDRWFYTYGIPSRIHSNWGKSFDNQIITSPLHHVWGQMI